MSQHQDAIYANDRIDLILPYGKIDEEFYQQIIAPYEPTVINDQFVVIHIPIRPNELLENIRFVYSLVPNLYIPLDTTSLEVSGILQTQNQPGLNLHGKNVLLGFVDTGINYTHPAFLSADGQTRIVEIWDQTVPSSTGDGPFGYGTVYTAEQIREAVNLENPLSLVPVTDPEGHGTFIAGVAAGSENRQQEFIGAANEAQIAVVKLKEAKQPLQNFYFYSGEKPVYQENDIMTGIQYLVELAERLKLHWGVTREIIWDIPPLISLYRDWVRFRELSALLQREMKQERHIIILVMLQDIPSPHLWKFWFPRAVLDSLQNCGAFHRNCSR